MQDCMSFEELSRYSRRIWLTLHIEKANPTAILFFCVVFVAAL